MSWTACRFCKAHGVASDMVKYGTRHYAHAVCLYKARGIAAIDALPDVIIRRLPVGLLRAAGVTDAQVKVWLQRIVDANAKAGAK